MPDIPNVPGVPSLSSYAPNNFVLAVADTFIAVGALLLPSWGVYVNGSPVIIPASIFSQVLSPELGAISQVAALIGVPNVVPVIASTVEFEYSANSPISNYPQEQGAFQSYDKVQLPFDVKLKLASGGTPSQRQAFFGTLEALRTTATVVDIVTPEGVYASCNCTHIDYLRRSDHGVTLIIADATFEQVRVQDATTFSNTQQPGDASQQSLGNVQPQTIPSDVSQKFSIAGTVF